MAAVPSLRALGLGARWRPVNVYLQTPPPPAWWCSQPPRTRGSAAGSALPWSCGARGAVGAGSASDRGAVLRSPPPVTTWLGSV